MTDRVAAYVVTLKEDVRVDDAEAITNAILMIRGVATVQPIMADMVTHIAEDRVKTRYQMAVYAAVRAVFERKEEI